MPKPPVPTTSPPLAHTIHDVPARWFQGAALRGAVWTMAGFGASQILRFSFNLVLTRLLFPELFGLMALVYSIMTGLSLFCDAGIAANIVRAPRGDDPAFLKTAWTLQIVRGFGLACVCLVIAWPMGALYGDRRLIWVLPMIGLANLIAAFNSTSLATLQRRMAVRTLVVVDVGTQVFSGVLMIAWARVSPGIWALIAGTMAAAV